MPSPGPIHLELLEKLRSLLHLPPSFSPGKSSAWKERFSLEVYRGEERIFFSRSRWLYPLFELDEYLVHHDHKTEDLMLYDRIAGRAAAALICRMGFTRCHINIVSQPALTLFEKQGVTCAFDRLVRRIACRTEEIIHEHMDLDEIYPLLKRRTRSDRGIAIEIQNLQAGYQGKTILKNLSLSLAAGEQLIITGDNGEGKTTLLKTVIGILPPQGGRVILGDRKNQRKGNSILPVGYVTQSIKASSFPLTAGEVVAMGLRGQRYSRRDALDQVEMAMRSTGCFALGHRNFYTLSGGEQRRVSLARCLCQRAGLILMDEPTAFLDADAKEELREVLQKIVSRQNPTILLVSHDHHWINQVGWATRKMKGGYLC